MHRLAMAERDAVLLRILCVFESHAGARLPSLVDRYLQLRHTIPDCLRRFRQIIEDVFRYRGIGNAAVQHAVAMIHECYGDSTLQESVVAASVGVSPSALCATFKAHVGQTFSEYLREVRLDHAARLLVSSAARVKEVWASVGFSDGANFCHEFRRRFMTSPSEYRSRGIGPCGFTRVGVVSGTAVKPFRRPLVTPRRILIVDDDEGSREILGAKLRHDGYTTVLAHSGCEALKCARVHPADAVVLDYHLPDMSGMDWLRTLRQRQPAPNPPVVIFTADWGVEDDRSVAGALGAIVMSKLVDLTEVERVLASLCAMKGSSGEGSWITSYAESSW